MGLHQTIYIGPYLEVVVKLEEVREDRCKQPASCPDPKRKDGRYCATCGMDLDGPYVAPGDTLDGRFLTRLRAPSPCDVIEEVPGYDIDSFVDSESPDPNPEDFRNRVKRVIVTPNQEEEGSIWPPSDRQDSVSEMTHVDIPLLIMNFTTGHGRVIKALRDAFESAEVKYGAIVSWG